MADIADKQHTIKRVVTEQPLQINLHWHKEDEGTETKVFAITMRSLGGISI
jgi:hypothetical protein